MAFSYLVRSSLPRARALISPALMDLRKSFRLNPSPFASSGSHHNNNHHLSSSTPNLYSPSLALFRFFSDRTLNERGSELLNKEATFGDGKGRKSDQSNERDVDPWYSRQGLLFWSYVVAVICCFGPTVTKFAYKVGVEEKKKNGFEEFKQKLLEPGFVSKIAVDHDVAVVYLKKYTEVVRVVEPEQPTDIGVYLLGIKSPESFKQKLEEAQKMSSIEPVPVIDVTKNHPPDRKELN